MFTNDLKALYRHYVIPNEIEQLYELEEQLNKDNLSLSVIGLCPCTEFAPYAITPPDCIPFVETGGAGIHFAFLTEFGHVTDL